MTPAPTRFLPATAYWNIIVIATAFGAAAANNNPAGAGICVGIGTMFLLAFVYRCVCHLASRHERSRDRRGDAADGR